MRRFGLSGGVINSRMVSKTILDRASYFFSRALSRLLAGDQMDAPLYLERERVVSHPRF
jgi:hypothetical protein